MRAGLFRKVFILLILFCLFYAIIRFLRKNPPGTRNYNPRKYPIVLWWTELIPNYHRILHCGLYSCTFTTDRKVLENKDPMVIAFYGSDVNVTDLPLPRNKNHLWALIHEESPKNVAFLQYEDVLKHFNLTSTFSQYSSFPLTTQYMENIELLTTKQYLLPIGEKTKLRRKEKLAAVVFIQSICDTMSGRDEYVKELMEYVEVDSYGRCLNNKKLPESLSRDYLSKIESEEFYRFLSKYKFILSYENGICEDYITEKFWRPLIVGSIPIYYGAPNIKEWMPNEKSAILVEDFDSPKELANFIKKLDKDDRSYNKYLNHKYSQIRPISNEKLRQNLLNKTYRKYTLFEDFECFLCEQMYERKTFAAINQKHYNCGGKLHFPKMTTKIEKNDWNSVVKYGKCEAKILDEFLKENKPFSGTDFFDILDRKTLNSFDDC